MYKRGVVWLLLKQTGMPAEGLDALQSRTSKVHPRVGAVLGSASEGTAPDANVSDGGARLDTLRGTSPVWKVSSKGEEFRNCGVLGKDGCIWL